MKPYHKLFLTLLLLEFSGFAIAQKVSNAARVNFIKSQYAEINRNLKSYRREIKTDPVETTEGNEVSLYFSGKEIKKIEAIYYGESGKLIEEYYFFNRELIFFYSADSHYIVPINVNASGKVASVKEERYYFKNGRIFKLKPIATAEKIEFLSIGTQADVQKLLSLK
jgi:hypothetical protein